MNRVLLSSAAVIVVVGLAAQQDAAGYCHGTDGAR